MKGPHQSVTVFFSIFTKRGDESIKEEWIETPAGISKR